MLKVENYEEFKETLLRSLFSKPVSFLIYLLILYFFYPISSEISTYCLNSNLIKMIYDVPWYVRIFCMLCLITLILYTFYFVLYKFKDNKDKLFTDKKISLKIISIFSIIILLFTMSALYAISILCHALKPEIYDVTQKRVSYLILLSIFFVFMIWFTISLVMIANNITSIHRAINKPLYIILLYNSYQVLDYLISSIASHDKLNILSIIAKAILENRTSLGLITVSFLHIFIFDKFMLKAKELLQETQDKTDQL